MLTNDWLFLLAIFVLICVNTLYQRSWGRKRGTVYGYAMGVYCTINYLVRNEIIKDDKDSEPGERTADRVANIAEYVITNMKKTQINEDSYENFVERFDG